MLVLTRKVEQWIEIGSTIKVMVLGQKPDGGVVLGIEAPRDMIILRGPEHSGTTPPGGAIPGMGRDE